MTTDLVEELVAGGMPLDGPSPEVSAEVRIGDQSVALDNPGPPCLHKAQLNISQGGESEPVVAFVVDNQGNVIDWQVKIKIRCGECGVPFEPDLTGRRPLDGSPGLVVSVRPVEDHPPTSESSTSTLSAQSRPQEETPCS